MSKKIHLTLACGDYEIVRALKEGSVKPDGIELTVLTAMTSDVRHWRMLRNREFDVAELSMSSYLMARFTAQPFTAIPVFLHRRFRHGFIFVNASKGIHKPADLIGKRVGLRNFQATTNLWVRGILEHEFNIPHKSLQWYTQDEEEVEFTPPLGLSIQRTPSQRKVERMLLEGELEAVIHPEVIQPLADRDKRVSRLFENYKELEIGYYNRTGIFPIMHTTAIKQEIIDQHPWVPVNLLQAFHKAKEVAYRRMENPRIVPLAWFQDSQEEQEEILGKDPWAYGLAPVNRKNLETLIQYSHEQGLIGTELRVDDLFCKSVLT
ncbi:MAG: ABC transporter substrate-binding protein [Deltaproteobacteria bacterium]|nr:ABC transporter substrate-binding protein [Deltaproteobacteria bacterium]